MAVNSLTPEQQKMLMNAEAAVEKLSSGYVPILLEGLEKLSLELKAGSDDRALVLAHTIQGQAGSFGWPLVSEAAVHLYKIIEVQGDNPIKAYTVKSIIDTIELMLTKGMKGNTPEGQKLLADIVSMVNSTPT